MEAHKYRGDGKSDEFQDPSIKLNKRTPYFPHSASSVQPFYSIVNLPSPHSSNLTMVAMLANCLLLT